MTTSFLLPVSPPVYDLKHSYFVTFCSPSKIRHKRILQPSEIVDILKGFIIIVCIFILSYIDMAMMYHMIKSQSVIKLYLFFNMLEVKVCIKQHCKCY